MMSELNFLTNRKKKKIDGKRSKIQNLYRISDKSFGPVPSESTVTRTSYFSGT